MRLFLGGAFDLVLKVEDVSQESFVVTTDALGLTDAARSIGMGCHVFVLTQSVLVGSNA